MYSVVIPILSEVIAYIDRDGNLELVNNEQTWTSRFWFSVLQSPSVAVMHYEGFLNPEHNVIRERVLMTTSGYARHSFQCQFPFSWLIKERVDSIWRDASNISGSYAKLLYALLLKSFLSTIKCSNSGLANPLF